MPKLCPELLPALGTFTTGGNVREEETGSGERLVRCPSCEHLSGTSDNLVEWPTRCPTRVDDLSEKPEGRKRHLRSLHLIDIKSNDQQTLGARLIRCPTRKYITATIPKE
jgi:hypothetical protein